jgi:2,3-bisphosphoglycerate-independent phosphoglycerate mutase
VKYIVIIPDGAADLPIPQLGDRTPFEAARTPNLTAIAAEGRVGCAHTTPPEFEAGSDVCSMSLLGYSPTKYHTGRAPLEAAALGIQTGPRDFIFRLNLVTTGLDGSAEAGRMLDHSAGAITDNEARVLVKDLVQFWQTREPELARGLELTPGVSYRNILVDKSGRDYKSVTATPPHAIPGEAWADHLPQGPGAEPGVLRRLMELSAEYLPRHEVNLARKSQGLRMATMAWIWGQGVRPTVPAFHERFGVRGAMITSVDLLAGIASYIGWDRLNVPGLTSYHDTDYAAQGRATCEAIDRYDIVCCHVEAPDEASHQADWKTKLASIEAIDELVVGPIIKKLKSFGDPEREPDAEGWRLLVLPDHYTLCSTRKHDATPVPFLMAGAYVKSVVQRPFNEAAALESDLRIDPGHDLMEYFLKGGLANVRSRSAGRGSGGRSGGSSLGFGSGGRR